MATIYQTLSALMQVPASADQHWREHQGNAIRAKRWQTVFDADDPSDAVYLLLDGEVRAFVGDESETRTTLLLRSPAFFGERDLRLGATARETYEFITTGRILVWSAELFLAEWQADPRLQQALELDLAARYAASLTVAAWGMKSLEARVAALLEAGSSALADASPTVQTEYLARVTNSAEKSIQRALTQIRKPQGSVSTKDDTREPPLVSAPLFHSLSQAQFGRHARV